MALACTASLAPPPPTADPPIPTEVSALHAQVQLVGLGRAPMPSGGFGGIELQLNASVLGIGAAAGVFWEQSPPGVDARSWQGGGIILAAQWRFVGSIIGDAWVYVDPSLELGFLLGGGADGGSPAFRGAVFLGAGVTLPLRHDNPQLVLSVQYRYLPAQLPAIIPDHALLIGLGLRETLR